MPASADAVRDAVVAISDVGGVAVDPDALAEDALALSYAFEDDADYLAAVANTCRALVQLRDGKVETSALKHNYAGWYSYHYQHVVAQGARADMRIMYRVEEGRVFLRAFGHRDTPDDFYERVALRRRP